MNTYRILAMVLGAGFALNTGVLAQNTTPTPDKKKTITQPLLHKHLEPVPGSTTLPPRNIVAPLKTAPAATLPLPAPRATGTTVSRPAPSASQARVSSFSFQIPQPHGVAAPSAVFPVTSAGFAYQPNPFNSGFNTFGTPNAPWRSNTVYGPITVTPITVQPIRVSALTLANMSNPWSSWNSWSPWNSWNSWSNPWNSWNTWANPWNTWANPWNTWGWNANPWMMQNPMTFGNPFGFNNFGWGWGPNNFARGLGSNNNFLGFPGAGFNNNFIPGNFGNANFGNGLNVPWAMGGGFGGFQNNGGFAAGFGR
jgi:hypothetical protein